MSRQKEILSYIKAFNETHNRMPSSAECCEDLIIGRGSLARILNRLASNRKLIKIERNAIPYIFPVGSVK